MLTPCRPSMRSPQAPKPTAVRLGHWSLLPSHTTQQRSVVSTLQPGAQSGQHGPIHLVQCCPPDLTQRGEVYFSHTRAHCITLELQSVTSLRNDILESSNERHQEVCHGRQLR